ncbi:hypothetical protein TYRP_016834 [Tyrophagus putrescentiae]|nr:hypothetical protein TYRP_016834 [Tyrophagus putrescentiae]
MITSFWLWGVVLRQVARFENLKEVLRHVLVHFESVVEKHFVTAQSIGREQSSNARPDRLRGVQPPLVALKAGQKLVGNPLSPRGPLFLQAHNPQGAHRGEDGQSGQVVAAVDEGPLSNRSKFRLAPGVFLVGPESAGGHVPHKGSSLLDRLSADAVGHRSTGELHQSGHLEVVGGVDQADEGGVVEVAEEEVVIVGNVGVAALPANRFRPTALDAQREVVIGIVAALLSRQAFRLLQVTFQVVLQVVAHPLQQKFQRF